MKDYTKGLRDVKGPLLKPWPRLVLRVLWIGVVFAAWLWVQSSLAESLAKGLDLPYRRASGLVGALDYGVLSILMLRHAFTQITSKPEEP